MTHKNGLNREALKRALESSTLQERLSLGARYAAWIKQGARAQGWWGWVGGVCFLVGTLAALKMFESEPGNPPLYAACFVLAASGVALFVVAARREREWRERNPFDVNE